MNLKRHHRIETLQRPPKDLLFPFHRPEPYRCHCLPQQAGLVRLGSIINIITIITINNIATIIIIDITTITIKTISTTIAIVSFTDYLTYLLTI